MKRISLFFLNVCVCFVSAQDTMTLDAVQDSVTKQLNIFPQEKIHVHTDRTIYSSGEKIRFKAYVVDAFSHYSPTLSNYAYIELINASDSLVQREMVTLDEDKLFHGHLFLSEFVPEGDYTLRAYTRYMENLGDDYFFKKHIRINNFKQEEKQAIKQTKRQSAVTYDVSFFPEGGYLTEGVQNRVTFKALNTKGFAEPITGEIVDKEGTLLAEVRTVYAGMGSFTIVPDAKKIYYLKCKNQDGQEKRFQLPAARKTFTITTNYLNKHFIAEVKKSPDIPEQPLFLLIHHRGDVMYFEAWNHKNKTIALPCEQMPSGIIQLTLFDGQMNPVSERLIFNKNDDQTQTVFSKDKPFYQKRDLVLSEIRVTDADGNPLSGHVSVAVTDDRDVAVDTCYTILSSLLLSSELKGFIETPGYYLQDHADATLALDLLMMTHGWRRYEIPEAIKGKYKRPTTKFEEFKEISGKVSSTLLVWSVKESEVFLISSAGDAAQVEIDSTGSFHFFCHYPDSTQFILQARNNRERTHVLLELNHESFPALKHAPKSLFPGSFGGYTGSPTRDETAGFIKKAEQRALYDDDMRLLQLPEVVVSAKKNPRIEELQLFAGSRNSSFYSKQDLMTTNTIQTLDLFRKIPGFFVTKGVDGDELVASGGYCPCLNGQPTAMSIKDIDVNNIEGVEIVKGIFAKYFCVGGNPEYAVNIITKTESGTFKKNSVNKSVYSPIGYQRPVEFYSPKYEILESKHLGNPDFRTTIYWKPNLILADDGRASFDFYTSDFPTTYSVVIEGLSDEGQIIRQVETIEIK